GRYACTPPPFAPWSPVLGVKLPNVLDYKWELYNTNDDYSQYYDISAQYPEKLKELQDVFTKEAWKNNVFPLDNSGFARFLEPRPGAGLKEFTYRGEISNISQANAPPTIARSFTITSDVEVPQSGVEGMIATNGGNAGGFGLYVVKGKPVFTYNLLGLERYRWASPQALTPGKHTIVFDFSYDGPGAAKGGTGVLKVD